jgi:aryl-alcohol dehydrogenase-like predicted oxidoreductase
MRQLGRGGPKVSAIGLGCYTMTSAYGPGDEAAGIATIHRARELGINFLDTADVYGPHVNEELVGRALRGRREAFMVATKFGLVRKPGENTFSAVNGRPEYVRAACEASLQRLGIETIDLYYQHRVDPTVPIEETVGAMAGLVEAGKVRWLGLSEASTATLRRACAVHPIAALQNEYSLWFREAEDETLGVCRELGVGFVPYSPLGRGFLTGELKSPDDFAAGDFRRNLPRFQGENFNRNLDLVKRIEQMAAARGCTAAQLALAWVLAQGDDIIPIPGTKRVKYLEQNIAAVDLKLSPDELRAIDELFPRQAAAGARYPDALMRFVNR